MNRLEYLQWCKDRANKLVNEQKLQEAFTSMVSDLNNHEETKLDTTASMLGMGLLMGGHLNTSDQMRKWIDGHG